MNSNVEVLRRMGERNVHFLKYTTLTIFDTKFLKNPTILLKFISTLIPSNFLCRTIPKQINKQSFSQITNTLYPTHAFQSFGIPEMLEIIPNMVLRFKEDQASINNNICT